MPKGVGSVGRPGWRHAITMLLARVQQPGIRLRDLFVLYALAISAMIVVFALFFVPLMWIFS